MFITKPNYLHKLHTSFPFCRFSSLTTTNTHLTSILNHFLSNPNLHYTSLLQTHALILISGHTNNLFISAKLISLYSSFNKPNFSTQVFNSLTTKDSFLWNSIIKTHFSNGDYKEALRLFVEMRRSYCEVNHFTIPMVVGSAAEILGYEMGRSVHCLDMKIGCFVEGLAAVGSSFVYMYSKCGEMEDAGKVFDEMSVRDVVAWTALIVGYVQNEESEMGWRCFCEMHKNGGDGEMPNVRTIEGGLQACKKLGNSLYGGCLHGYAVKTGSAGSQIVQSSLLSMYSVCENSDEAYHVFQELVKKDIISWTVIIGVYARAGSISKCLELFSEMLVSGIYPDEIVISCMLSCFGNAGKAYESKAFHGTMIKRNYKVDKMVSKSLLSMYCKCGLFDIADKLFSRLDECDMEAWNIMVSGYGKMGPATKCIGMYKEMWCLGLECDLSSIALVISACSQLAALHLGQSLHCHVIKGGIDEIISVTNALVSMYGRLGDLGTAQTIFNRDQRDIVTWNTMMSAYTRQEHFSEALSLFDKMVSENLEPNTVTLVIVLSACSQVASMDYGKRVHAFARNMGLECDLSVATALVDMYAKCGHPLLSREIFDSVTQRDVVLWNVMISGYGLHGDAKSAIDIFQQMEASDVRPNVLSFLAVLSSCNHAGLVEEAKYLFSRMRHYSIVPNLKHYACMVDLLGRSGNLQDAEAMVQSMPISPDGGIWGSLLNACNIHNNIEIGERVAKRATESDPENDGYFIVLCNMYSFLGKWEEAEKVREIMTNRGLRKRTGWSEV
ncbi:hypothetical protein ACHQM5_022806 [Ranunculus cassubicifolius]